MAAQPGLRRRGDSAARPRPERRVLRQVGSAARSREIWLWCAVAAVSLAAFLAHAWLEPVDHGYVRYLGIADEMVRSGDWVVPRVESRVYLEKPPLFVWLVAAPIAALGEVPSWAQHLPNLLAGALLAIWSFALARLALGSRGAGLVAAVGVLTTLRTVTALRDERLDALFAALLAGAFFHAYVVLAPARGGEELRRRAAHGAAAGALLGLALMTKGPVALALFAPAVAGYAVWARRGRALWGAPAALGLLALLAVALPWPLLLVHRLGVDALAATLEKTRMVTRFSGPFHYLVQFPVELAPWSPFVVAFCMGRFERGSQRPPLTEPMRFSLVWALAVLAVLELSPAKHSRYLLPMFPPLLVWLLTLWYVPGSGAPPALGRRTLWLRDGTLALLLGALALAGVAAALSPLFVSEGSAPVAVLGACVAALAAGSLWRRRHRGRAGLRDLAAVLLLALAAMDAGRAAGYREGRCWSGARRALAAVPAEASWVALGLDETRRLEASLAGGRNPRPLRSIDGLAKQLEEGELTGDVVVLAPETLGADLEARESLEVHRLGELCLRHHALVLWRVDPRFQGRGASGPGAEANAPAAAAGGRPPADQRGAGP